jgi:hypothetical protein
VAGKQKGGKPDCQATERKLAEPKASDEEVGQISPDHADVPVLKAFGTQSWDFMKGLIRQLAGAGSKGGELKKRDLHFLLSVINQAEPRDQLEAMLVAQMAAVHMHAMNFAQQLNCVQTINQQDSAERAFTKLTRTFVAQLEALKRYRGEGEQKVTVQKVSVGDGGQAIVGNVTQASRAPAAEAAQTSPPALTHSKQEPMPLIEQSASARVPVPRKQRGQK